MSIGFIGTGTISAALVEGLQRLPQPPEIVVSPRSEAVSRALAERFAGVRRAASNPEAAAADIVVLGMRPAQLEAALTGIGFARGQIVVSLVAGLSLDELARRAPRARVCRVVPLPGIARGVGPITVYPGLPEVVALLEPLGDLLIAEDEARLNMGGLSAFMSSYFELQARLVQTAVAAGVPEDAARRYVVSLLSMLAGTAEQTPGARFGDLVAEHQTRGGLNERVRAALLADGWFDTPGRALRTIDDLRWQTLG